MLGNGLTKFHGVCLVKGDCILDFTELESHEVSCISLRDNSRTFVGPTRIISRANLHNDAILTYSGNPGILNFTVSGNSRIEAVESVGRVESRLKPLSVNRYSPAASKLFVSPFDIPRLSGSR